jgi:hypothetical protein
MPQGTQGDLRGKSKIRKLRGQDSNLRPRGYEPRELPDCSTPRPVSVFATDCESPPASKRGILQQFGGKSTSQTASGATACLCQLEDQWACGTFCLVTGIKWDKIGSQAVLFKVVQFPNRGFLCHQPIWGRFAAQGFRRKARGNLTIAPVPFRSGMQVRSRRCLTSPRSSSLRPWFESPRVWIRRRSCPRSSPRQQRPSRWQIHRHSGRQRLLSPNPARNRGFSSRTRCLPSTRR